MIISKYQDVKSISKLPKSEWKLIKFEDLLIDNTKQATKIKKEDYYDEGDFPIIDQGKNYVSGYTSSSEGLYEKFPSIIFGDHTRALKYVNSPLFLGADGVKLLENKKSEEEVLTKYIYYYLCTVNIPNTGYNRHFKYLKEIVFPIPNILMQKKIVQILDKSHEIINKRIVQIDALDQLTKSVFWEMFGDPLQNTKQWPMVEFSDICDTRLGKMLDKKKQTGENTRSYLANRNVQWGHFILDDLPQMNFRDEELETLSLKKGDLLICEGGEVGRTAIWEWDDKNIYFQKALHRARIKNNLATPEYLQSVMLYFGAKGGFKDFTSKATIAHLTGVKLKRMPIPNPPINKQQQFTIITNKIKQERSLLLINLKEMENLFNSIMQCAFKGELFTQEKLPNA